MRRPLARAKARGTLEAAQASAEWVAIAALVAALMIPACIGIWNAAQGLYSNLDRREDVIAAKAPARDTVSVTFIWAVVASPGDRVPTSSGSFGTDFELSLYPGDPLPRPSVDKPGYTFSHWAEAGRLAVPVTVPDTCPQKSKAYIAVYTANS